MSHDLESHFEKLELVLQKFQEAGLKFNLPKCKFLCSCIEFLGHVVDKDGIHTTDAKVQAVQDFPIPKSVNHVRSFLCLVGYHRALHRLSRVFSKRKSLSYGMTPSKLTLTDSNMHSLMLQSLPFQITVWFLHSSLMQVP